MKSDWQRVRLGDLCSVITKGATPRKEVMTNKGVAFVRAENIVDGLLCSNNLKYVSAEVNESLLRRSQLANDDLLITIAGAIGRVARVDKSVLPANINQAIAIARISSQEVCCSYVYYYLRQSIVTQRLIAIASGQSVQSNLNLKQVGEIEISLPPLPTQRRIAAVLSSLDDKIELNRKMNVNLEAQAQALFKSWFVDFEPWGGKMPAGWKKGKLSEIAEVCYGKDHKALKNGSYPVYGSGGIMRYAERPLYDKESVLIPRKGTLNNIMYSQKPFWTVDTMFYTKTLVPNSTKYLFLSLQGKDMMSFNVGSAVPSMTTAILNQMEILIPNEEVLSKFEGLMKPIFAQQGLLEHESLKLAELRDALLPKLMSGELEVAG